MLIGPYPTTIRLSEKCRIALLLFAAMLAVVILVFSPATEVSAEVSGGTISDGIYQITNVYLEDNYSNYGTFYLRGENGAVELTTNTYGNLSDNLYNYWYFEHQGNNEYMIYSMADYSKALSMSGSDAVLTSAGSAFRWIVQSNNGGYQLLSAYTPTNDLLTVATSPIGHQHATNGSYYYYTNDVFVGPIAGMTIDRWNIIPASIGGLYFQNTSTGDLCDTFSRTYHINRSSVSLESMGYTITAITNSGISSPSSLTWTSSNSSVAIAQLGGVVSLVGGGQTIISARATINGSTENISYTLNVKLLNDGVYFLWNIETDLYADIENGMVSNGNAIEKQTFDGSGSQKWNFTHIGANVYTITLRDNPSYYMGIASGTVDSEPGIILCTGPVTDRMKWKVEHGVLGWKIVSYLNSRYVVAVDTDGTSPGENLILGDWQNNTSYKDEWYLTTLEDYPNVFSESHIPSKQFTIQCTGTLAEGSTWYPLIQSSAEAWDNAVNSDITVTKSIESQYTCEVDSYVYQWLGLTTVGSIYPDYTAQAIIKINTRTCDTDATSRKSVIAHEIGHLFGLADNPPVSNNTSLMCQYRDRSVVYLPQYFDVESVKYIYGN